MDIINFIGKLVIGQVSERAVDKVLEPVPVWVYLLGMAIVLGTMGWWLYTGYRAIMG